MKKYKVTVYQVQRGEKIWANEKYIQFEIKAATYHAAQTQADRIAKCMSSGEGEFYWYFAMVTSIDDTMLNTSYVSQLSMIGYGK